MLIMALYVIKRSTVTGDVIKTGVLKQFRDETIALILFFGILAGTSELITRGGAAFLWKGLLSSLMSFGGGDAYLTVADGLFVQSEIITEDQFYSTLVPTVNILPGSILCKTLSGIGYLYGLDQIGTHAGAIAMAVIGFACSVVASCGVFTLVGYVYECFGNLTIFRQIKKWIRPIVSGLMGNVMLSLIYQSKKLGIQIQKPLIPIWVMIGIFVVDMVLQERYGTKRVVAILIAAVMSVGILCVVV
jgi:chromate transporter